VIIEKANAANKANGLPDVDFFETMDVNQVRQVSKL